MPEAIKSYVRYVESVNRVVGLVAMYLIVAMLGILFYSAITKAFFLPSLWTLEMAQFVMVAYYLLGGGYTLQTGAHVRMDLLYSSCRPRTKAAVDSVTILFLIFFLVMLLYGGISSTEYAIRYGEESYSAWAPKMWPIKAIMTLAILLTLLQAIATFFRNVAEARGMPIVTGHEIDPESAS
ncbi:TRAP transporter small permease subunit [Microbaculum marinum]|uniref:TRAP transporter small permease protein n=1 Tax=Microbaculum marinum TaxID=1764581 RepID=A0AAW9RRN9_9HYPH